MTSSTLPEKFKNRVPVVLNKGKGVLIELEKGKFLINKDTTLGQFAMMLRRKNKLTPTEAIYIFCNNVLPQSNATMMDLWTQHHDKDDDILYLTCAKENTFG